MIEEEMAASLQDILIRRTAIFFWEEDAGLSAIDAIADSLADHLAWSEEKKTKLQTTANG